MMVTSARFKHPLLLFKQEPDAFTYSETAKIYCTDQQRFLIDLTYPGQVRILL